MIKYDYMIIPWENNLIPTSIFLFTQFPHDDNSYPLLQTICYTRPSWVLSGHFEGPSQPGCKVSHAQNQATSQGAAVHLLIGKKKQHWKEAKLIISAYGWFMDAI